MDNLTKKEASKIWEITDRMVIYHRSTRQIKKTNIMANIWLILVYAEKCANGQYISSNVKVGEKM